jgi:hypothetical protein
MAYKDFADILANDVKPSALEVTQNLWVVISERSTLELPHEDDIRKRGRGSSPALRMPLEILGEVFQHLVPGYLDTYTKTIVDSLCLVCKCWNDAARLSNQLWAHVSVHVTNGFVEIVSLEKIVAWLSRAGDIPRFLDIFLRDADDSDDDSANPDLYFLQPPRATMSPSFESTFPLWELLARGPPLYHLFFSFSNPSCFKGIFKSLCSPEARQSTACPWDQIQSVTFLLPGEPDWDDDEVFFYFQQPPRISHPS